MSKITPQEQLTPAPVNELVEFLVTGELISEATARHLSSVDLPVREAIVEEVLSVVVDDGSEAEGVVLRSDWVRRIAGGNGVGILGLMTQPPMRIEAKRNQQPTFTGRGVLAYGSHSSYDKGVHLSNPWHT